MGRRQRVLSPSPPMVMEIVVGHSDSFTFDLVVIVGY